MMSDGYLLDVASGHHHTDDLDVDWNARTLLSSLEIRGDNQSGCLSLSSSSDRPNAGRYLPKFNSKSLGTP
jgi:hypothetical protein